MLGRLEQDAVKESAQGSTAVATSTVIMEPTSVGNMVGLMMNSLGARNADDGRSFFSKPGCGAKVGEKLFDDRVTIFSDPSDPRVLTTPFNNQGLPNRRWRGNR